MARLTTKERKALPASDYAIPPTKNHPGEYPDEDKSHAVDALGRVEQNGSPAQIAEVKAAVHKKYPTIGEHKK